MSTGVEVVSANGKRFDLVVIGGGIHGANVAREAALRGMSVLLLESGDFSCGTSSRSSKMLHGGVRYLEQGNVSLVKEAQAERAYYLHAAPHLSRTERFVFPIIPGITRPGWQVSFGLWLYDKLAAFFSKGDLKAAAEQFKPYIKLGKNTDTYKKLLSFGLVPQAAYIYSDGQMDDARIVVETVLDAKQLGAIALNYSSVSGITRDQDGDWKVEWRSTVPGSEATNRMESSGYQCSARFIVNTAGPWVERVDGLIDKWKDNWPGVIYSRGIHLLFDVEWDLPGLILPTGTKGRYYFVWPFYSPEGCSTLVGTTDQRTEKIDLDPQADKDEVEELLEFLRRDLPRSGLNKDSLYTTFCGIRVLGKKRSLLASLGFKSNEDATSKLSRTEIFLERENYLALLGGKYTTSRMTAEKIVTQVAKKIVRKKVENGTGSLRKLPGGYNSAGEREEISNGLQSAISQLLEGEDSSDSLGREIAELITARFGRKSLKILTEFQGNDTVFYTPSQQPLCTLSEIFYTIEYEGARTVEDVLRRRLGLRLSSKDTSELENVIQKMLDSSVEGE